MFNFLNEKLTIQFFDFGEIGEDICAFLSHLKKFKDTCFSTTFGCGYEKIANDFKTSFQAVNQNWKLSVPLKLHVLFEHIIRWVGLIEKDSEHPIEATHAVFDDLWESFIVKDVETRHI